MKFIVYKITNELDGKIYIGCHKTEDINDGYMGSGSYLKRAQEKHNIENFTKEILHVFDTAEEMFDMESMLVNEDFAQSKETYNLKLGGEGGFDYINSTGLNNNGDKFQWYIEKLKDDEFRELDTKIKSERFKRLHREGKFKYDTFTGKSHTPEAKKKIGDANAKHQKGEGNSQYGSMWIYHINLEENKKIKKDDFPSWEQDGWLKGCKMKYHKKWKTRK